MDSKLDEVASLETAESLRVLAEEAKFSREFSTIWKESDDEPAER